MAQPKPTDWCATVIDDDGTMCGHMFADHNQPDDDDAPGCAVFTSRGELDFSHLEDCPCPGFTPRPPTETPPPRTRRGQLAEGA